MWGSEQRVCASMQGYGNWAAKYNQCTPRWWHSLLPPCRLHTLGLQNQVDTASMDSGLWILKVCFMVFLPPPLEVCPEPPCSVHGSSPWLQPTELWWGACHWWLCRYLRVCWLPPVVRGTATTLSFRDVPCCASPLISCLFKQQFGKVKEYSQVGKGRPS